MKYVNLTPAWAAVLPMWLMMYRQAITGDCTNPSLIRANAEAEFKRMADAADRCNSLIRGLREQGFDDAKLTEVINLGKMLQSADALIEHEADVDEMARHNEGLAPDA